MNAAQLNATLDDIDAALQAREVLEPVFTFTQSELAAFYHRAQVEMILLMGQSPSDSNH